ncbi:uncharacterized protein LOC106154558 [Lingula anatina]|uniref:Uncharacterized protein LOC106154558 n=1 Tax=Lingula anatina TaxID=7574 RepID=A0A1S3HEH0_LINAN|nr:uncharacterized protein LOC106154558 [Lingula anatina]|eukprot:XP_013384405.1 uncharacterized protein LOC106154558 [Lingula anatina]
MLKGVILLLVVGLVHHIRATESDDLGSTKGCTAKADKAHCWAQFRYKQWPIDFNATIEVNLTLVSPQTLRLILIGDHKELKDVTLPTSKVPDAVCDEVSDTSIWCVSFKQWSSQNGGLSANTIFTFKLKYAPLTSTINAGSWALSKKLSSRLHFNKYVRMRAEPSV